MRACEKKQGSAKRAADATRSFFAWAGAGSEKPIGADKRNAAETPAYATYCYKHTRSTVWNGVTRSAANIQHRARAGCPVCAVPLTAPVTVLSIETCGAGLSSSGSSRSENGLRPLTLNPCHLSDHSLITPSCGPGSQRETPRSVRPDATTAAEAGSSGDKLREETAT
ncbi:hypothetical protein AAFF_G00268320 [Aldrovandia affinis]|uniref:Uncharacterized protein n=1 Tax=Aldrovandia affinis TaxID=143900 RepID=A0AAD7WSW1_9TELE|nr:hypothetical protein AAFF_G00268320 [Aldrovandia affinis]